MKAIRCLKKGPFELANCIKLVCMWHGKVKLHCKTVKQSFCPSERFSATLKWKNQLLSWKWFRNSTILSVLRRKPKKNNRWKEKHKVIPLALPHTNKILLKCHLDFQKKKIAWYLKWPSRLVIRLLKLKYKIKWRLKKNMMMLLLQATQLLN